uniref:HSF_DOMAIN domain-containing protein n=1 Tax=Ascaris lumbricoides TaxID=6252 RepID=A0A0M3HZQ4_ASCLU
MPEAYIRRASARRSQSPPSMALRPAVLLSVRRGRQHFYVDPALDNAIATFTYVPDENVTFETWFKRYEDNFNVDAQKLDDAGRVRFLLRKHDAIAYEKYANYLLPKLPRDLKFGETISILKDIFGPKVSIFNQSYHCLRLVRNPETTSGIWQHRQPGVREVSSGRTQRREVQMPHLHMRTPIAADAEYRLHLLNNRQMWRQGTIQAVDKKRQMWRHAFRQGMPTLQPQVRSVRKHRSQGRLLRMQSETAEAEDQRTTPAPSVGRYSKRQDEDGCSTTSKVRHRAHRWTEFDSKWTQDRTSPSYQRRHGSDSDPLVYSQSRRKPSTHQTIQSVFLDRRPERSRPTDARRQDASSWAIATTRATYWDSTSSTKDEMDERNGVTQTRPVTYDLLVGSEVWMHHVDHPTSPKEHQTGGLSSRCSAQIAAGRF